MDDFQKKHLSVSIIVPAYNVQDYIVECIASLRNQTYSNIEIILVDDGSSDKTGEICDSYASKDVRIKVIHQKNSGVTSARRKGLENATGKYVSFVDADDWIDSDMIHNMVELMVDSALVTTGVFREKIKNHPEIRKDDFDEGVYEGDGFKSLLKTMIYDAENEKLQPLTPWIFNKLYITDIIREAYADVDDNLVYGEDSALLYAYILRISKIVISHQAYYHYRYREDSAIHKVNEHRLDDVMRTYRCIKAMLCDQEQLIYQLQKWLVSVICCSINESMGFDKRVFLPEFIADLNGLENKQIVLYGAGNVGKSYYYQMRKKGYNIVAWVDRAYESLGDEGVISPKKMEDYLYDVVLIAIESAKTAGSIKESLVKQGVQKEKVVWRAPFKVY